MRQIESMPEHQCDPSTDPNETPVTRARVLRLVVAYLNGPDLEAVDDAIVELGNCPGCLAMSLIMASGIAAQTMQNHVPNALMAAELVLAAAEGEAKRFDRS